MYATDTTDIKLDLDVKPYYMYHASRRHQLRYEALWFKTWPGFKLCIWLAENCHDHDMGVAPQALKPDQAVNEEWLQHQNTL